MSGTRKASFPASVDEATQLLILGSLPGEISLAARQYYANPTNQFWPLLGGVLGENVAALPYEARLERLLARGVGLWDVVRSARRIGSGDGAIRDHRANPLAELVARLSGLRGIGFNGGKAAAIGRKQLAGVPADLIDLPSSSAAYCTIPFAAKQERWMALRPFVRSSPA